MDCGFRFMRISQEWICCCKLARPKLEEFSCILSLWIMRRNLNSKNLCMESKKLSLKDQGKPYLLNRTALSY